MLLTAVFQSHTPRLDTARSKSGPIQQIDVQHLSSGLYFDMDGQPEAVRIAYGGAFINDNCF